MTRQTELFKGQSIEVQDTRRITKRAEYDKAKGQSPHFGMSEQEQYVLRREANRDLVKQRRIELAQSRVSDNGRGLTGQTIACPMDAKDIPNGLVSISRGAINTWGNKVYYFCISVNETHESFWWDIDELAEIFKVTTEDTIVVAVDEALEYHRPIKMPFGWPWGKSPLQNRGLEFKGHIYLTDRMAARPGFDGYGNLHPSGGESEGYYCVK